MNLLVRIAPVLAACFMLATQARAADKVTFGLDWVAEPEYGGYYQALATGIYKKYGLDVSIVQGGPQVNNAELLVAGRLTFDITSNSFLALNFVQQDIPYVAIAAGFQKDPDILMAHASMGDDRFEDLAGKPIAVSSDTRASWWLYLKAKYGYSDSQLKAYGFSLTPFLTDPHAIQEAYVTSEPYLVAQQTGKNPVVLMISDAGFDGYASLIATSEKLVKTDPDLVQRFINASIEGWYSFLYGDPAPAFAAILKANPDMTPGLLHYGYAQLKERGIVDSGSAATLGIGAMTDARWQAFFDQMAAAGLYDKSMDYKAGYTLQFVDKGFGKPKSMMDITGVSKQFPNGTLALQDISASIAEGDFVALLGPSGCGKSTLLRLMAGLEAPTDGVIFWRDGTPELGGIGFVFQDATLMPWASAEDNVFLPLKLRGKTKTESKEKIAAALAQVALSDFTSAKPAALSGGMKMRVSIARALVSQPRLLLMDEPFAALDEFTRHKLQEDLRNLWREKGKTIVFVTHSVYEAAYLATRILVMSPRPGRIAANISSQVADTPDRRTSADYAALVKQLTNLLHAVMPA